MELLEEGLTETCIGHTSAREEDVPLVFAGCRTCLSRNSRAHVPQSAHRHDVRSLRVN
jgi:hypothetical protein